MPNVGQLSPSGERIRAPLGPLNIALRGWHMATWTSCFSITTFGKSAFLAPGGLRTLMQPSLSSLPFVLFPSPFSLSPLSFSLSWNFSLLRSLSFLTSVLSFWESGHQTATASLLPACETCSLWPAVAHLDGWQAEVGEARLTLCKP